MTFELPTATEPTETEGGTVTEKAFLNALHAQNKFLSRLHVGGNFGSQDEMTGDNKDLHALRRAQEREMWSREPDLHPQIVHDRWWGELPTERGGVPNEPLTLKRYGEFALQFH